MTTRLPCSLRAQLALGINISTMARARRSLSALSWPLRLTEFRQRLVAASDRDKADLRYPDCSPDCCPSVRSVTPGPRERLPSHP
jgi:hypothetical protein